jgi:adenosylhomocysteine nucleosidase
MPKIAFIAAMEREVSSFIHDWKRVTRQHEGRTFLFFERDELVCVCGGIGMEAARRSTQAAIALYKPSLIKSVGFAGALDARLHVGDIFAPSQVIDARDGSRYQLSQGEGTLVTFMEVASVAQKAKLHHSYQAQAVDMEAAAVAAAASLHGIAFDAIKVISDEADFDIPGTSQFITAAGEFRICNFIGHMALRPAQWGNVLRLAMNSRKAAEALTKHLRQTSASSANIPIPNPTFSTGGRN